MLESLISKIKKNIDRNNSIIKKNKEIYFKKSKVFIKKGYNKYIDAYIIFLCKENEKYSAINNVLCDILNFIEKK